MAKTRMALLAGVVVVLVMLNIVRFVGDDQPVSTSVRGYPQVEPLPMASRFRVDNLEVGGRDIFLAKGPDASEGSPAQEMEVEPEPAPDPQPEGELIDAANKVDLDVLGIGRRANRGVALIRYQGKTLFVSVGDRVGDDYIVRDINHLNIYLSRQ